VSSRGSRWNCCSSNLNGVLRLAVPSDWGAEQRQHLLQALELGEDQASFGLALADDLSEALGALQNLREASPPSWSFPSPNSY
jgi:hypothetical protein